MIVLVPLRPDVEETAAGGADLHWWAAGGDATGAALAELAARLPAPPGTAWVACVRGSAAAVRYACDVAGAEPVAGWRRGRERTAALGPLHVDQVLAVLDAADTVTIDVDARRVANGAAADPVSVFGTAGSPPVTADAVLRLGGGAPPRLALSSPPPPLPGVHIAAAGDAPPAAVRVPEAPPSRQPVRAVRPWRSAPTRASAFLAAAVAVGVVAAATAWGVTRGRGGPAGATPFPHPVASAPSPAPAARFGAAVAYDQARSRIVLVGGVDAYDQTWAGSGQAWQQLHPSVSPPGRFAAAAAWDPSMNAVLLFGGRARNGDLLGDTWSWDGTSWARLAAGRPGPPPGEYPGMAWDAEHRVMVLVAVPAGSSYGNGPAQTWTWDGHGWSRQETADAPVAAAFSAMTYDRATRSVLLVAADNANGTRSATWRWDGARWLRLAPAHQPSVRQSVATLAADPGTARPLLLSPGPDSRGPWLTYTWDGADWVQQPGSATRGRVDLLVADRRDGVVLALGGPTGSDRGLDRAWAWTGRTWTMLAHPGYTGLAGALPPARRGAGMAYDAARGEEVLFGGQSLQTPGPGGVLRDTWVWDGVRWQQRHPAVSPPAPGPMAYDSATRTVVMLAHTSGAGLTAPFDETWLWNGSIWARAGAAEVDLSSPASVLLLVADPADSGVLAVTLCCTGRNGTFPFSPTATTWRWDGHQWMQPLDTGAVTPGGDGWTELRGVADAVHGEVVVVASKGDRGPAETWTGGAGGWSRRLTETVPPVDPLTAVLAADDAHGEVLLQQAPFVEAQTFDPVDAVYAWDGGGWTAHPGVALASEDADTAFGTTTPYFDPGLGRPVLLGDDGAGYSRAWMWTGSRWLWLAPGTR